MMKRQWLINIRNSKGLTQQEVADRSKIERAYYTMIEQGTRNPSVTVAMRLSETLDLPWTYFFEEKGNDTKQLKVN